MSATKGKVIKCKAAVVWEFGKPITQEEIEVQPPAKNEVRVKISYTGVCQSDLSGWKGITPSLKLPLLLGHEGAGIVESIGEGVQSVKEGDHILTFCMPQCQACPLCKSTENNLCMKFLPQGNVEKTSPPKLQCKGKELHTFVNCGTYTEYALLSEAVITKVPKEAPLDKIVLLSCGVTTGYGTAVRKAKVKQGSTCVVFGLGTVGLAAAMGCKNQGAKRIIGVDINNDKKDIAKTFGVTEFYNPTEYDKPIETVLTEKTMGGCDYAFECIGNLGVMDSALKSCRIGGGQCFIIGIPPIGKTLNTDPYQILFGRELHGCLMGNFRVKELPSLVNDYMQKKIMLDEFITGTYPITEVNKAFETIGKGASVKTLMTV